MINKNILFIILGLPTKSVLRGGAKDGVVVLIDGDLDSSKMYNLKPQSVQFLGISTTVFYRLSKKVN